jgi:hypothetical protein
MMQGRLFRVPYYIIVMLVDQDGTTIGGAAHFRVTCNGNDEFFHVF